MAEVIPSTCSKINKCAKKYKENQCGEFAVSDEMKSRLITCSAEEKSVAFPKTAKKIAKSCVFSASESTKKFFEGLPDAPAKFIGFVQNDIKIGNRAYEICSEEIGSTFKQIQDDKSGSRERFKRMSDFNKCVDQTTLELKKFPPPTWK